MTTDYGAGFGAVVGAGFGDLSYGYDDAGQIVAQGGSFALQDLPSAVTDTAFDDNQRQTAFNGQNLTYDANGNLLSDGQRTYVWNARNRLERIEAGAATVARFEYDAAGRRILKWENGQTTEYLYDGHNAVQEKHGATVIPVLTGLGIDQRYARTDTVGQTYFLTDHLGSTRALTDANGNIVQRYDYTPYGQTTASAAGFSNPYQYTGRELDQSGLYYYRARYYSPQMGRFISEDPIGLAGGLNVYGYVGGDPVNLIDPEGDQARRAVPARPLTTSEVFAREQVPQLVREIQRHDPSFRYQTVGPRGQVYNRQDVDFLRDILRQHRSQDKTCPTRIDYGGTPGGIPYSRHYSTERGYRGIPGSVIDSIVNNNTGSPGRNGTTVYYDSINNVTVIVGNNGIVTAYRGR